MVNSMNTKNIRNFKNYVVNHLMEKYKMDEFSARKAVRNSYLTIALKLDANTAMHDSIEYWADYIYNEELHGTFSEELKEM